ncbi:MAG: DUF1593 domain-containing protein, partial [Bacteroidales bacterium]|nr:DUF1593 domain-containing protein [Bacteroidales bacterium]
MKFHKVLLSCAAVAIAMSSLSGCCQKLQDPNGPVKIRTIVTCDPELDDNNSLVRFLLFSDGYDVEGLIYASSQVHWKGDGKGGTQYIPGREYARPGRDLGPQTSWRWAEGERSLDANVEAYEKVYPNLKAHNPNYPTPEYLKSVIREGNVAFEGEMSEDTPGSDLIKQVILDNDPRPVYIQAWGGPSTIARALKSIQDQYEGTAEWESIKAKVYAKVKLCLSGLQDQTFKEYIKPNWPEIVSLIKNAGVTPIGYGAKRGVADKADTLYYSAEWTSENIMGKGALSDRYRVWGDGQQMAPGDFTDYFGLSGYTAEELTKMGYWVWQQPQPKGNFISEGDTPEFLNLIGNGLRAWEDPRWGGWAGRQKELSEREKEAGAVAAFGMRGSIDPVLPDFVPAVQNNFAARLSWCTTADYKAVNHEPKVKGILSMTAKAGETVKLPAEVSDPDGDAVECYWKQYKVLDSFQGDVTIADATSPSTSVTIPSDAK